MALVSVDMNYRVPNGKVLGRPRFANKKLFQVFAI
jgi:hypothetical protein